MRIRAICQGELVNLSIFDKNLLTCDALRGIMQLKGAMSMNGKSKNTRWMYLACGMISAAGAAVFAFLGIAVREMIHSEPLMSAHAAGIYLYVAGAAVPCALAVGMLAAVIHEIGRERAFTARNERWMRGIAGMAFLECAYLLAGLIGWSMVGLMHPGVMIIALALILFGAGVGMLAWALAGLIGKASDIQQENELTV